MGDWNVKIKDFQSLKSVDIDIKNGITIITGPTNNGKTAILRAIESSLFNSMSDDMVRSGKNIAGVTISNGSHSMVYMRNARGKSEKTAYQFDGGNIQKKVGRSQLPEVAKMFGVTDVRMNNGVKVRLNFWEQGDKPFLMDKTAGQLFEFLTISSADRYFKVLKTIAADIKIQEAEINNSNTVIDTLKSINNSKQEFVDKNKGFTDVYENIITLGSNADKFNRNTEILENLTKIGNTIKSINTVQKEVENRLKQMPIDTLKFKVDNLLYKKAEYDKSYMQAVKLINIKKDISSADSSLKTFSESYQAVSTLLQSNKDNLERITKMGNTVKSLSDKIKNCEIAVSNMKSISDKIGSIEIPDIDFLKIDSNITYIKSVQSQIEVNNKKIKDLSILGNKIEKLISVLDEVESKIEDNESNLEDLKRDIGYCPFCGSVFNN